jgi:hypothetical protein
MVSDATLLSGREELAELDEQFSGPIRRVLPIFPRNPARTKADVARFRVEAQRDFGFDDD